jgi:hypothetical protein
VHVSHRSPKSEESKHSVNAEATALLRHTDAAENASILEGGNIWIDLDRVTERPGRIIVYGIRVTLLLEDGSREPNKLSASILQITDGITIPRCTKVGSPDDSIRVCFFSFFPFFWCESVG